MTRCPGCREQACSGKKGSCDVGGHALRSNESEFQSVRRSSRTPTTAHQPTKTAKRFLVARSLAAITSGLLPPSYACLKCSPRLVASTTARTAVRQAVAMRPGAPGVADPAASGSSSCLSSSSPPDDTVLDDRCDEPRRKRRSDRDGIAYSTVPHRAHYANANMAGKESLHHTN